MVIPTFETSTIENVNFFEQRNYTLFICIRSTPEALNINIIIMLLIVYEQWAFLICDIHQESRSQHKIAINLNKTSFFIIENKMYFLTKTKFQIMTSTPNIKLILNKNNASFCYETKEGYTGDFIKERQEKKISFSTLSNGHASEPVQTHDIFIYFSCDFLWESKANRSEKKEFHKKYIKKSFSLKSLDLFVYWAVCIVE